MSAGDFKRAYEAGQASFHARFAGMTFAISFAIAFIVSDAVSYLYGLSFLYRTLVSFVKRRLGGSDAGPDQQ